MTVPSTARRAGPFTGTGALVSYPFTFKVFAKEDLAVTTADTNGLETSQVLDSGFLVTLNVDQDATPGGSVQYAVGGVATALPTGYRLAITGDGLEFEQTADLPQGGNFDPEVIENALDREVMLLQNLREALDRVLQVGVTSGTSLALPAPVAGQLLGWNATLDGLVNYAPDASSAAGLQIRLANPASPVDGDAMIAALRSEAGALADTIHAFYQRREVDAEQFTSIQAALNSGAAIVNLTAPSYNLGAGLTIPAGVTLRGRGKAKTTITLTANITPFNVTNVSDARVEELLVVAFATQTASIIKLTASSVTIARNNFRGIQVSGSATNFAFIELTAGAAFGAWNNQFQDMSGSGLGSVVKLGTTFAGSWVRANKFRDFYVNDFIKGVEILNTAGDGAGENTFSGWGAQTSARTTFCVQIPNSTLAENQQNTFIDVAFYDLIGGAVHYFIGSNVRDTAILGSTGDPILPSRFTDNGIRTDAPSLKDRLPVLWERGRDLVLPTHTGYSTTGSTGSFTVAQRLTALQLDTGVTNPSTALAFTTDAIAGLAANAILAIDFGKAFVLEFGVARTTSQAAAVGRVQLKQVQAAGSLAAAGLGLQINNYAMTGESYGSTLGGVALGSLTDNQITRIKIKHFPGSRVEFWVNGAYVAQQTTTTAVPSGTVACYLVAVLGNNSATNVGMWVTQPRMWAEA